MALYLGEEKIDAFKLIEIEIEKPEVIEKDVNFYDYDGTLVASYTAQDFANLTAMPNNPTHTNLTSQGWNWNLNTAKTFVNKYGKLDIGQIYATSDGKTRIYITLQEGRLGPYLGLAVNGSVDVDWGDGSPHGTLTGTSTSTVIYLGHTYSQAGNYIIALTVTGTASIVGSSSNNSLLITKNSNVNDNTVYINSINKIEIGQNVSISSYALRGCSNIKYIIIPNTVNDIPAGTLGGCGLDVVILPNSVTSLRDNAISNNGTIRMIIPSQDTSFFGSQVFDTNRYLKSMIIPERSNIIQYGLRNCSSLTSLIIGEGLTNIYGNFCSGCSSLANITIPSTVTKIEQGAFYNCYGLAIIKFVSSTPPTASNSNWYQGVPTDCKILVPTGSLSAYTGATNYPSSSTYTYEEY